MNQTVKLILSNISLILVLVLNYLSNTDTLGEGSVGGVSRKYDTLFAPAGYAFAIWGLIYLLLILFVIYQWYLLTKGDKFDIINKTGIWFSIANIANGLWVLAWVNEYIAVSVLLMLLLLFSLFRLVIRLDLENWDAPLTVMAFVWWPITIYFGWIVLATVANISAFLVSLGWDGGGISPVLWTIILIIIATAIYLFLTYKRNLREAACVGIWGLVAIAYRQWNDYPEIAITALLSAAVLLVYVSYHAYQNRVHSPFKKL